MCYKVDWYFANESNPSDRLVDQFKDSKFSIDKWTSFTREIIQNALDVPIEENGTKKTVIVKMSYNNLPISKIPGGEKLKYILSRAKEKATNSQTKSAYETGLNNLNNEFITCLKVSDYNTLGVRAGRDKEWGALVYDEGNSKKRRPGAAGSHGVGKKAPFIISSVNTVFYSTTTEDGDQLSQGKCSLVNWDDENGITKAPIGWFGIIDESPTIDRKEKIKPINNQINSDIIDKYFIRPANEQGTDVIMVAVKIDDPNAIKDKIINAVLENFFIAIDTKLLEVEIFGEKITNENLSDIIDRYFTNNRRTLTRDKESDNLKYGNLKNYYDTYKYTNDTVKIPLEINSNVYGYAELYFHLQNDKGRKYYCIFREHGMKIKDIRLSTDQSFTGVIVIKDPTESALKDEDKINNRLAKTENAAHDDFITNDDEIKCDETTKALVDMLYKKAEEIIKSKTTIQTQEETPLQGLSDMLSIQGVLSSSVRKEKPKLIAKKRKIKKKGKGKKALDYENGVTAAGGLKPRSIPAKEAGENKPAQKGNDFKATLFENYSVEPVVLHIGDKFVVKFVPNVNVPYASVRITPISVDERLMPINNLLTEAYSTDEKYIVKNNTIYNVSLKSSKEKTIVFKIKNNLNYSFNCEVMVGEKND